MSRPYKVQDRYFKQAKREGYRARSAYKLLAIDQHHQVIDNNDRVLDLGCFPGSWLQVLVNKAKEVVGVDLEVCEPIDGATILQADVFSPELKQKLGDQPFDLITADLAPKTSGIRDVDHGRSVELNEQVIELCIDLLKPGGKLVSKIFSGSEIELFVRELKKKFKTVKRYRPPAVRERSFEEYIIAKGYKK